ncbi:MAG: hypothetical protein EBT20_06290 [Alphaproteobacteria bacterium]|nr:hypothetical protein [Alphaproteobacteria bacterium]
MTAYVGTNFPEQSTWLHLYGTLNVNKAISWSACLSPRDRPLVLDARSDILCLAVQLDDGVDDETR